MDARDILIFLISLNVLFYVFGYRAFDNDILTNVFDKAKLDNGNLAISSQVDSATPKEVKQGFVLEVAQIFFDGLALVWDFIKLLLNLVTSPLVIFTGTLHPTIALMISAPILIAYILSLILLMRSGGL